jgi:hypothetical protein
VIIDVPVIRLSRLLCPMPVNGSTQMAVSKVVRESSNNVYGDKQNCSKIWGKTRFQVDIIT